MEKGAGSNVAVFDGGDWGLKSTGTYYAYYPFSQDNFASENMNENVGYSYDGQQVCFADDNGIVDLSRYDFMATGASYLEGGVVNFRFKHLGALCRLRFKAPASGTFARICIEAGNDVFPLTGYYDCTDKDGDGVFALVCDSSRASCLTLSIPGDRYFEADEYVETYFLMPPVDLSGENLRFCLYDGEDVCYSADSQGDNILSGMSYGFDAEFVEETVPEIYKRRVLVNAFLTAGDAHSPQIIDLMHQTLSVESTAENIVYTECHETIFNYSPDPAFIKTTYGNFAGVSGYPHLFVDMYDSHLGTYPGGVSGMTDFLMGFHDSKADRPAAGVSVSSSAEDNKMTTSVTVNSPVAGEYRIGAYLVEDGVYAKQYFATEDWMNTHDNVIRYIDAGEETYYGHPLGSVAAGESVEYVFEWDLDSIWTEGNRNCQMYGNAEWEPFNMEKLHAVVFVTAAAQNASGEEYWYVNNVVDCPLGSELPFDYLNE